MFCTKCGAKLNAGEAICPQCGYTRQQGYPQQLNQQGYPQQPNQQEYPPNNLETGNIAAKAFGQLGNMQLLGLGGCLLMFISMFLAFLSLGYGQYSESATLWEIFSDVYEQPFFGFVTLILIIVAAIFCIRNDLKKAAIFGAMGIVPPLIAWAFILPEAGDALHIAFGGYLFVVGAVLIIVACYKKEQGNT